MDWCEKYRPSLMSDVEGQPDVVKKARKWAQSWSTGKTPGLLLEGPPGLGKTSLALAIANEMEWNLLEINASESKTKKDIDKYLLTLNSGGFNLDGTYTRNNALLLDEADNIDKRNLTPLFALLKKSKHPVIMTCNDIKKFKKRSSSIQDRCLTLSFKPAKPGVIVNMLRKVLDEEEVEVSEAILKKIVQNNRGDVRACLNDLQHMCQDANSLQVHDLQVLQDRDHEMNMWKLLSLVFKEDDLHQIRRGLYKLSLSDTEESLKWLEENSWDKGDVRSMARSMESLSQADLFLGRRRNTMNFRLNIYARDCMAYGVNRNSRTDSYIDYRFPALFMELSRGRSQRNNIKSILHKLKECVCSQDDTLNMAYITQLYKTRPDFQEYCKERGLTTNELALLQKLAGIKTRSWC